MSHALVDKRNHRTHDATIKNGPPQHFPLRSTIKNLKSIHENVRLSFAVPLYRHGAEGNSKLCGVALGTDVQ